MGFGRGTGFTSRAVQLFASYLIRSGGGKVTNTEITLSDEVTELKGGGGKASKSETALAESVELSLGSL